MNSKFPTDPAMYSFLPPSILGHLTFQPKPATSEPLPPGMHKLNASCGEPNERDTLLFVPEGLDTSKPAKLLVMFHGAGGSAQKVLPDFQSHAEKHKFLLMLPQSTYQTWDLTVGGNGPDLQKLDQALADLNTHFTIDTGHFGFCGFSDGASYSLSIGLSNGHILSHIIALSGGFMNLYVPRGKPKVFIAHSPEDEQLPMNTSGLFHYKELKQNGYDVIFHEFHGRHLIHQPVVEAALDFFLKETP